MKPGFQNNKKSIQITNDFKGRYLKSKLFWTAVI